MRIFPIYEISWNYFYFEDSSEFNNGSGYLCGSSLIHGHGFGDSIIGDGSGNGTGRGQMKYPIQLIQYWQL